MKVVSTSSLNAQGSPMTNPFIELAYAKIKQHQDAIFMVLTCVLIVCGTFWLVQDKQAGHHEFQSALIVERIYKPATSDTIFFPVGDGSMMTVDASTPSRYLVKIALKDKDDVEVVRVKKDLFKNLHQGQSVNFDRWVGHSGIIYWKDIEPIASAPNQSTQLHS
jgi:hypothetical protein